MVQKMEKTVNAIYYFTGLIMLFLIAMHFQGYVEEDIIKWAVILLIISVIINRRLELDLEFIVLLCTMILYGLIFKYYYSDTEYWQNWHFEDAVWPPVLMYLLCRQLSWKQKQIKIEGLLLAVCFGTFVYSILNHLAYAQNGFFSSERIWNEFWTHSARYATEFSYWGIFIVGLLGYALYCLAEKKWIQGGIICVLIGLENYIQILVDNRMVLMVTVVVAAVSAVLFLYLNRHDRKKIKILCIGIVLVIATALVIIIGNVGGVRDSAFFIHFTTRDGGILGNIRFQMIWDAIRKLPSHWKGGGTMYPAGHSCVHNYWLQAANDTGIFTFILWMIFNISMIISVIKCAINPKINIRLKFLVIPLMSAVVAYLSMEIGGQGASEYILFYVMIVAILRQLVKNENQGCRDSL